MTEGPYYLDGDKLRRDIREGRPGTRLDLATRWSTSRPASRSRAGSSTSGTATRAARTPVSRRRHRRRHVHARHPADDEDRTRDVRHGLPGLVLGPHRPYPRPGVARRERRCTPGSSSSRRRSRTPSTAARRTTGGRAVTRGTRPTRSSGTAARSRCSSSRRPRRATPRASRWASAARKTERLPAARRRNCGRTGGGAAEPSPPRPSPVHVARYSLDPWRSRATSRPGGFRPSRTSPRSSTTRIAATATSTSDQSPTSIRRSGASRPRSTASAWPRSKGACTRSATPRSRSRS